MKKLLLLALLSYYCSYSQLPYPLPAARDTSNFGKYLQRTMKLLATSTPSKRNTVKILVYGQSISKQEWSDTVRKMLKIRYPNANIIMINRSIGGCWAGCLQNPMEYDIKTFYPDLILFDVYGWNAWGGDQGTEYEAILNYIRQNTSAELAIQNHHVGSGDVNSGNVNSGGARFFSELAQKYGAELIDMRTPWFKYMQDNSLTVTALAPDGTHLNDRGNFLMARLYMPYLQYKTKWITADTFGLLTTYKVGIDIFPVNGKITLPFNGNKVDAVHANPVASMDSASIIIDGKRPSSIAGTVMFTRPNEPYDTIFKHFGSFDWPWQKGAVMKFNPNTSPLLRGQNWTLKFLTYNAGSNFTYTVTGTKTGGDGTGSANINSGLAASGSVFTSSSGQVVINPSQFWFSNGPYSALPLAPGFSITWEARPFYTNTYIPSSISSGVIDSVSVLAQGIANTNHVLEIDAKGNKNTPIREIRIYRPYFNRIAPNFTITAPNLSVTSPVTICAGNTVNLTTSFIDLKSLTGIVTYWHDASATLSITAPNLISISGTYYIKKQAIVGGKSDIKPVVITVFPSTTISINGVSTVCNGTFTSLTASGANTYLWSNGSTNPILSTSVAGMYTVTGSTNGCSSTLTRNVNVTALPTIAINGVSTVCSGSFTSLTASGANTYLWSNGSTNPILSTSVAGIYTVVGLANGCSSSSTRNINVFALPTIAINGVSTVCNGTFASLTASGANTYLWSNGSTNTIIATTVAGAITVIGFASGCSANNSTIVVFTPSLNIGINGVSTICNGAFASLTATGANSYLWSSGSTNPIISTSIAGIISLFGTANGCSNTIAGQIFVNPIPTVLINGVSTICSGTFASFTASGANTYLWSNGSSNPILSTSVTGMYTVTGSANGCSTTLTRNVNITALPTIAINGVSTICSGSFASLTASGANTYLWSNGSSNPILSTSVAGMYTVTGSANGCSTTVTRNVIITALPTIAINGISTICSGSFSSLTASGTNTYLWSNGSTNPILSTSVAGMYTVTGSTNGCSTTLARNVNITALPTIAINGVSTVCNGTFASLTASGANTYLWSNGITNPLISSSVAGIYTVTGLANGCSSSSTRNINVFALPTIAINGVSTVCSGTFASLTASGANTYLWSNGSTNPILSTSVAGIYSVLGTDMNVCSSTINTLLTSDNCQPLNVVPADNFEINVIPNPANEKIFIDSKIVSIISVNVFDNLGNTVLESIEKEIDVSTLANGIYQILIQTKEGNVVKKVVVIH